MIEDDAARYLLKFFRVFENVSLKNFTRRYIREKSRKRKRIQALLYGVITRYFTLERVAKEALGGKFEKLSSRRRMLILVYLYRILYQGIVPPEVKRDVILRPLANAKFPVPEDEFDAVAIETSFPRWVVGKLANYLPLSEIRSYLGGLNERKPLYLLANPARYDPETAADYLKIQGVETVVDKDFPELLMVTKTYRSIHKTSLYKDGDILPISKASFGVVKALDPKPGDRILDLCAAPGIKTIATHFLCGGECEIVANDIEKSRLNRMRNLLTKHGIEGIELYNIDAREFKLDEKYDKILIDAPCTSTGMIPDSPDIKLRVNEEKLRNFVDLQRTILENITQQINEEVTVVYSVCSIFPEEGEIQILGLKEAYDLEVNDIGFGGKSLIEESLGTRFYPHLHETIAMFITKFKRKK